ncbi:hypothetical protein VNO80_21969 [Phaseolus coccineus]|uniref:Uncharacterized protein n=1 Tax=Phaseolus coccineus TaxID=3886 RepID=A0AAN9M744_PHACN
MKNQSPCCDDEGAAAAAGLPRGREFGLEFRWRREGLGLQKSESGKWNRRNARDRCRVAEITRERGQQE